MQNVRFVTYIIYNIIIYFSQKCFLFVFIPTMEVDGNQNILETTFQKHLRCFIGAHLTQSSFICITWKRASTHSLSFHFLQKKRKSGAKCVCLNDNKWSFLVNHSYKVSGANFSTLF